MDIKIGILVIGSLIWDKESNRVVWRKQLDLRNHFPVAVPICYGRRSGKTRHHTFTMIFSNRLDTESKAGSAIVIPLKKIATTDQEFEQQMQSLADAEGISAIRLFKDWGTVCISVNPSLPVQKQNYIRSVWDKQVGTGRNNLRINQRQPNLSEYGVSTEQSSIDQGLYLTAGIEKLFDSDLQDFDVIAATSNAIRLNDKGIIKYATVKQIARAIFDSGYYDYFILNRYYNIKTFQDRQIAKTLKRRYKVNLARKKGEVLLKHLI